MSWLERAAKEGYEPDLKPQEIDNEKVTDRPNNDGHVTTDNGHEYDARRTA